MRFRATSVSAAVSGDYYQILLGPTESREDNPSQYEANGPYLLVQRQFEMFDGGRCYVETHDEACCGHYHLRLVDLSRTSLSFMLAQLGDVVIDVQFELSAEEFEGIRGVAEVIFGLREPEPEDDPAL